MALRRYVSSLASWFMTAAVLYGVYLLFAASVSKTELYVALGASVISTLAAAVFGTLGLVRFRPSLADLLQFWRVPGGIFSDTGKVMYALALRLFTRAGPPSRLAAAPFDSLQDDPRVAARRALGETFATMTPNTVVLGILRHQALVLYHQILPEPMPAVLQKLGGAES